MPTHSWSYACQRVSGMAAHGVALSDLSGSDLAAAKWLIDRGQLTLSNGQVAKPMGKRSRFKVYELDRFSE